MSPPGYKGSSHGDRGSASVRHTRSQRLYTARAISVRALHSRAASAHPDAPGCDAHHENMLCVARHILVRPDVRTLRARAAHRH